MNIGILGSGMVGQTLGTKLAALGYDVVLGTRDPANLNGRQGKVGSLAAWLESVGHTARVGTFAEAAVHGDLLMNATPGLASLAALVPIGERCLQDKVLVDVANELDFSRGMPPVCLATDREDGSVGERIQRAFPGARVVKALSTVSAELMADPRQVAGGDHTVFLCGDDDGAKSVVGDLLRALGWTDIFDLGGITAARGMEMLFPLWVRARGRLGHTRFGFKLVHS